MKKTGIFLTHGGAGSKNWFSDGADAAARRGLESLSAGLSILESVCVAVTVLEDDTRFNAGMGSYRRADGSAQMDAACMDSRNRFGAVAVLEGFKNPVLAAFGVSQTGYRLLAGRGAAEFARKLGLAQWPPPERVSAPDPPASADTVGCVGFDGEHFAAALSTGGKANSLAGRVGDVPFIGCGLYAGPSGAVAATGDGEEIVMKMAALRVYQMLERGADPRIALKTGIGWFDGAMDIGLILVSRKGYAGGSNRDMAWAAANSRK
jgi:isoaspartyl peptidase/L-asparaginase-like protein (Ntn-hydrolase superfamily)